MKTANRLSASAVSSVLSHGGFPRSRYAEDNSSGDVEVSRTGFDAQQHAESVRVYYWIRGQGARATAAQAEERRRAFLRMAPVLAQRYRVSGGDGPYLTVRAAASTGSRKRNAARAKATRYTMAQVRAQNKARSKRLGLGFSFFDKKTTKFHDTIAYSGPYSGAGGVFFVAASSWGSIAVYRFTPGEGSIDFEAHASGVEAARELARRLAKGQ